MREDLQLLEGHKTTLLLFIAVMYFLYFFLLTLPTFYSSVVHTWLYDPLIDDTSGNYYNYAHSTSNVVFIILICLVYLFFIQLAFKKASEQTQQAKWWRTVRDFY